jgi:hypothetical protein
MKTKQPPLPVIFLVLRPLVQVLKYYMNGTTNSWRVVIRHIERSFSQGDMTTPCQGVSACESCCLSFMQRRHGHCYPPADALKLKRLEMLIYVKF